MDYIKFETLDFSQQSGGGVKFSSDTISITSVNSIPSTLRFNVFMNDTLSKFEFMQVKRNPLTGQIYLVFNNDDGMTVRKRCHGVAGKENVCSIGSRKLCQFLVQKYGKNESGHTRLKISGDLSNDLRYATYEILGRK